MNELPDKEHRLEQLLERSLRALPARRAPMGLESRVLRELERRAARPWWHRSYGYWPSGARTAFVFVCAALAVLVLAGGNWTFDAIRSLHDSGALSMTSAHRISASLTAARDLWSLLMNAVPSEWLRVGLATGTVLYAVLFGLGAAAYRTLYLAPLNGR